MFVAVPVRRCAPLLNNFNFFKPAIYSNYIQTAVEATVSDSTETNHVDSADAFGTLKKCLEKLKSKKLEKPKVITIRKEHLNKFKSDKADQFGNLSEKEPIWYPDINEERKEDNDQSDDSVMIRNLDKKYRCPKIYLADMKKFVKERKLKEALDLFVTMKRNHVLPEHPHFTFMIGACGRTGYTEMAFKLLRQMTDRGMKPTSATLTGAFNSCAECPFPDYGLRKAKSLKEKIESKGWQITQITYHSMIKAFGKCGDLQMAFQIVDEMAKNDIKIDVVTYSFLLMSCIANKEAGFTHAVEVWRQMKKRKFKPNLFTCNLLLRAARDCDVGPEEISSLLLQHWSSYSKRPYGFETKKTIVEKDIICLPNDVSNEIHTDDLNITNIESSTGESKNDLDSLPREVNAVESYKVKSTSVEKMNLPKTSLLNLRPKDGPEILELLNIKTPSDRLSLIGGVEGFLQFMTDLKIKPDIKTFMLLLECLPGGIEHEENLISLLDLHKVQPDIDFFNILIKRRNFRKDSATARKVLLLINKYDLKPDIVTFGVLALGCRTHNQAVNFLNEIKKLGICPNIEIIGALFKNACIAVDFQYLKLILKFCAERQIRPNERIITKIEETLDAVRKNIIKEQRGEEMILKNKSLSADYKAFCSFYEEWLKIMDIEISEHPWLQYKTEIIDRAKEESV